MLNLIISLIFVIGGFKLLFEVRKKHNIYLAVGFILYGLQYLLKEFIIMDTILELVFNVPRLLGALCFMMSGVFYLKEGKE